MLVGIRNGATALALIVGAVALALLAAGPLGFRMGWWHYSTGFQTLMPWAAYIGIAAVALGLVSLVASFTADRGKLAAVIALVCGAVAIYFPWTASNMRGVHPRINDVTTDMTNPPAFVAALALRKTDGGNDGKYIADNAKEQAKHHADILAFKVARPLPEAFKLAEAVASAMPGWRVHARDAATGRIEASHASRWYGFTDDIAVRIAAEGAGSRIDVRSASRHGRGDFGVNAARVRAYLAALAAAAK